MKKKTLKQLIEDGAFPVLYILMRSDLASLNPGKAMAQATHAANAMVHRIKHGGTVPSKHIKNLLTKWENSTKQGFGTCLVLDCIDDSTILEAINQILNNSNNAIADIINDPTYPIRDGDMTHYVSLNTCGYVFCDKNDMSIQNTLENFELYK